MTPQLIRRLVVATFVTALTATALLVTPAVTAIGIPTASAACPAVEVIFARGRFEPAGPGQIGNTFVSALRKKSGKNVNLYACLLYTSPSPRCLLYTSPSPRD